MLHTYSDMQALLISHREHRELGEVVWLRDFEQALTLARANGKPILLLFQEIPGCSTCVNFGRDVLSHPLMVEMIQARFVPLAIFNNHPGADADIRRQFGEVSWNNPVIHFISADGEPVISRLADRYEPLGLHEKIVRILELQGTPVPAYFRLLRGDLMVEAGLAEAVTYATPCFWSGETSLAHHPAVIATDAGWVSGDEVVQVLIDPSKGGRAAVDNFAREEGFSPLDGRGFKLDREPQFYLRKSDMRHLPLSAAQRTAINLALPYRQDAKAILSPRQRAWLADARLKLSNDAEFYRQDIRQSWAIMERTLGLPALVDDAQAV